MYCVSQVFEYHFVSRTGKRFSDASKWVYWCSCDKDRSHFVNSCSTFIDSSYDKFISYSDECVHIEAARVMIANLDCIHEVSVEQDFSGV